MKSVLFKQIMKSQLQIFILFDLALSSLILGFQSARNFKFAASLVMNNYGVQPFSAMLLDLADNCKKSHDMNSARQ